LSDDIPHYASALSYALQGSRRPSDSLPTVMKIGAVAGSGLFSVEHEGLTLDADGRVANLNHVFGGAEERMALLDGLRAAQGQPTTGRVDFLRFQDQARRMMVDTELQSLLQGSTNEEDDTPYFQRQCETALRVLEADKGTRVFHMVLSGWDHHEQIYQENGEFHQLSGIFDRGLAFLLDGLAMAPAAQTPGGSLLDETLIVAVGEFGRTVGSPNTSGGRDHYPYVVPALVAGGGTAPGRIIGSTSVDGGGVLDPGWSQPRLITINDLVATIYSAMGVDWTQRILDTPSGRAFEFVDSSQIGTLYPIDDLFS
jgi:hypothetical protein